MRKPQHSSIDYAQESDIRAQSMGMIRSPSAGNVNEYPSRRMEESRRSHADLQDLEHFGTNETAEICMINDTTRKKQLVQSSPRSNEGCARRSASHQRRNGIRSSSRPRQPASSSAESSAKTPPIDRTRIQRSASFQPNSTGARGNLSSSRPRLGSSSSASAKTSPSDGAFRQAPHRSRSKTQLLLDRLNRPKDNTVEDVPLEVNHTLVSQDLLSKSIRSNKTEFLASCIEGGRPTRISVRVSRLQAKAATTIQATYRRFLVRSSYRRMLIKKQYRKCVDEERKQQSRLEKDRADYMGRLMALKQQTQNEINAMRAGREEEKTKMEASFRESFASVLDHVGTEGELEQHTTQIYEERVRLKNEQDQLTSEMRLLEGLLSDLEQENNKLRAANEKVTNMFTVLNQFARARVAENKRLEAEAQVYNKREVSKVQQEIKICSTGMIVESAAKDMYRGSMYRYVYDNVKSLNDQDLAKKAMEPLRQCEESLGNEVLSREEARALLEKNQYDSDSDDEEDD